MNLRDIDNLKAAGYEFAHSIDSASYGAVLLVKTKLDLQDLTYEETRVFRQCTEKVFYALEDLESIHDPEIQQRNQNEKEQLLACFGDRSIFVQDIPNEYLNRPFYPVWHIVTTEIGHIKTGWRKRVIVIDWSQTIVDKKADTLFPEEDVTKDGQMIHAWGYDKAKEYIDKLHEVA